MKPSHRRTLLAMSLAACAFAAQAQARAPGAAAPAANAPAAGPAASNGVISNPEFEKAGEMSAHAWLLLLDRKDWGSAWDISSAVFRQNVPLPAWMDGIPKLREPFGAFVQRQPVEVVYKRSIPGRPDGDYVTAVFLSKFATKPEVLEVVTVVREQDGRWRVTGYNPQ
jgi:hypothetical protein